MLITISLPEEVIPGIYDVFNTSIESECNIKSAIKYSELKILFKKAVRKGRGIKGKIIEFYDPKWVKKNFKRFNDMVKQ